MFPVPFLAESLDTEKEPDALLEIDGVHYPVRFHTAADRQRRTDELIRKKAEELAPKIADLLDKYNHLLEENEYI